MRNLLLTLIPLIAWSGPSRAADDIEAVLKDAFDRMATYRSWTADFTQSMTMMGSPASLTGQIMWRAQEMRMEMQMPPTMGGQKMVTVIDKAGIMWQDMAMGGQRQVIKMDTKQMAGGALAKMNKNPADQMDPRKQLEEMQKNFDLTLVAGQELHGQAMHVVDGTIKKNSTDPQVAMMAQQMGRQRLYIGKEDGFMHKVEIYGTDGQTLMMTMEFQNLKFNVDLADELFAFNPPPGVPVMDMSEMMQRALGGTPPPRPPAP